MLLSDTKTADFIRKNFVATWKMVRPVPKVTIDFGNGKKLERTLVGNTVLYVSLPDGTVVDAFPGVYTPADFATVTGPALKSAEDALSLEPSQRAGFLAKWHKSQVDLALSKELVKTTTSKAMVESPLLDAIGMVAVAPTAEGKAIINRPLPRTAVSPTMEAQSAFEAYASRIEDVSKKPASTEQLKTRLRLPKDTDSKTLAAKVLELDSRTNVTRVQTAVHLLLSAGGKKTADDLYGTLYKRLLHVDIDDPYLGLRDFTMPGTPNR